MNLAIDIGNTRVKTGIFNEGTIRESSLLITNNHDSFDLKTLKQLFKENHIDHVILCSVKKYPGEWKKFLSTHSAFYELSPASYKLLVIPHRLKIAYQTPETLGMDRLASVYGASAIFHGKNTLVINAGTCITYDFLSKNGIYKGGSISPGVDMRFKALHTFTAKLPLLELNMNFNALTGSSTYESIQSGVQQGIINEVNSIINAYQSRYKGLEVILTGGSSPWLLKQIKYKLLKSHKIEIKAEPFLLLKGLNVLLSFFIKNSK